MEPKNRRWQRSSYCEQASCLEVAFATDSVWIRDSKVDDGPSIELSRQQWADFVTFAKLSAA